MTNLIIVKDANILIDLFHTGLYGKIASMKLRFHTTQYVATEIIRTDQRCLLESMKASGDLIVDEFEDDDLLELLLFFMDNNGRNNLSEADCSVIFLARRLNCRLLTTDQKLKRVALEQGIEVNGFLWLTDRMVETGVATEAEMLKALELYLKENPRAPKEEVKKRIDAYLKIIKGGNE